MNKPWFIWIIVLLLLTPLVSATSITLTPTLATNDGTAALNIGDGINPEIRWIGTSKPESIRSMYRYAHSGIISLFQPEETAIVKIPGPQNPESLGATFWMITVYVRVYSNSDIGCITAKGDIPNNNEIVDIPLGGICGNYGYTVTSDIFGTNDPSFLGKEFTFYLDSMDSTVTKVEIFADTWYSTSSTNIIPTRNPSVTAGRDNSVLTSFSGNLHNGDTSRFQPLNGIQQNVDNLLRFNIAGSEKVFYEIRYETPPNKSPIANAGIDQAVSDNDINGFETITLDGSESSDSDGLIVGYEWREGSTVLGTTEIIEYGFQLGSHAITLTVTDDDGAISSDEIVINIAELSSRIAFLSKRDGNQEIYIMNADGSEQTRLTYSPTIDSYPALSHNGMLIAFECFDINGNPDICIMDHDGQNLRELTNQQGNAPSWSPDDSLIAFGSTRNWPTRLFIANSDALESGVRQITFGTEDNYSSWSWSPEQNKIAYNSYSTHSIMILDLLTLQATQLVGNIGEGGRSSWSPDGTRIAYSKQGDIYVIDVDGTNETRLTYEPGVDDVPSWSPDGDYIAFQSARSGETQIFVMNIDGGGVTQLTDTPSGNFKPSWGPSPFVQ